MHPDKSVCDSVKITLFTLLVTVGLCLCISNSVDAEDRVGESSATFDADLLQTRREQLNSRDPIVRGAAALALGKAPYPAETIIPDLIKSLADDHGAQEIPQGIPAMYVHSVGEYAAETLAKIGEPAVPQLRACLSSENAEVRRLAVRCLGEIGSPSRAASPEVLLLL